jgi:four helix bundle protein
MDFKFEELRVYQEAVELAQLLFEQTNNWPSSYKYSLADQLHRAALSISLNIAEGSGRTRKDFQHFLSVSRGSSYECIPIISIARNCKLINNLEYQNYYGRLLKIAKMLTLLRSRVA